MFKTIFQASTFKSRLAKCKQEIFPILFMSLFQAGYFIYLSPASWSFTKKIMYCMFTTLLYIFAFSRANIKNKFHYAPAEEKRSLMAKIGFALLINIPTLLAIGWYYQKNLTDCIFIYLSFIFFIILYYRAQDRSPNPVE